MSLNYSENYKDAPYWWDAAPRPRLTQTDLVRTVDVAVIGSGYTGLNAALQTVRAGRTTLVLERDSAGDGCSSRNGGQAGTSIKLPFTKLEKKFGRKTATGIIQEGNLALAYIKQLIEEESIDCDWHESGRFVGAHSSRALEYLLKQYKAMPQEIQIEHHVVSRAEQHQEISSDFYHGGCVIPAHGSLHPGKYHRELLNRVVDSGGLVLDQCAVSKIERMSIGFRLHTDRGTVDARDVVLATNGYTENQFRWHKQRILPIGSFQIATEPIPADIVSALIPKARVVSDTRQIGNYFRLTPDRKRVLFGGRVTFTEANSKSGSEVLYQQMTKVFPQLADAKVSHTWVGYVAYTTDICPHIGVHQNLYYAMGYCGSGITLSSYFGMKIGQKLLGTNDGKTAFDDLNFRPWPTIMRSKLVLGSATRFIRAVENFI